MRLATQTRATNLDENSYYSYRIRSVSYFGFVKAMFDMHEMHLDHGGCVLKSCLDYIECDSEGKRDREGERESWRFSKTNNNDLDDRDEKQLY